MIHQSFSAFEPYIWSGLALKLYYERIGNSKRRFGHLLNDKNKIFNFQSI